MSELQRPALAGHAMPQENSRDRAVPSEVAKGFETVFLSQFVDQMMKTVDPSAFGGEKQAEMWRSFLSEALADKLTEQGGFGLGESIEQVISSYENGKKLPG